MSLGGVDCRWGKGGDGEDEDEDAWSRAVDEENKRVGNSGRRQ